MVFTPWNLGTAELRLRQSLNDDEAAWLVNHVGAKRGVIAVRVSPGDPRHVSIDYDRDSIPVLRLLDFFRDAALSVAPVVRHERSPRAHRSEVPFGAARPIIRREDGRPASSSAAR